MKALSIRQPWAWLIVHGGKDIENRTWATKFRGKFLIHTGLRVAYAEYHAARSFAKARGVEVPSYEGLQFGGIIGEAELTDCVTKSTSPWFEGPNGFVLRNVKSVPFEPCRGALSFFTPKFKEGIQA